MRADRLISIMMLLQVHRRLTARELADRLEVSERTIHRDMEALSAAGIPVYAERGVGGGWSLVEGYETNLTGLSDTEIQTLFLSKPERLLTDLGLHSASESAMHKLLASLPAMQRRDAEYVQQRVHIDINGSSSNQEDIAYLPLIQQAIWQERRIQIVYELSTGPVVRPDLDPLGLVAKGNRWYLVAIYKGNNAVYRISRIYNAHILGEPCQRPPQFDLSTFWAESSDQYFANLPRYPVEVLAQREIVNRLRCWRRPGTVEIVSPPNSDGRQRVTLIFESEEEACAQCLSFGPQIEVMTPYHLRQQVFDQAKATVAHYSSDLVSTDTGTTSFQ